MRTKIVIVGFLAAVLGIALPSLASAQGMGAQGGEQQNTNKMPEGPPDATFDFEGEQFRLILGGGSGKGVLHYQGKDYPFTGKGASAGGIGVTKADALGKVYHLTKLSDFEGFYSGATIGGAVGKGGGGSSWQNKAGVVVTVQGKQTGVGLMLGITGWDIKFTKPPGM